MLVSVRGFSNNIAIGTTSSIGGNIVTDFGAGGQTTYNNQNIFWSVGTHNYRYSGGSSHTKFIYSDLMFIVNYKLNVGTSDVLTDYNTTNDNSTNVNKTIKYSLSGTGINATHNPSLSTPTNYLSFTGQHRCEPENKSLDYSNLNGYIVSATGEYNSLSTNETGKKNNINIADSLSIVKLTEKNNDKSVYGVICGIEETNERIFSNGMMTAYYPKEENDLERLYINSLGEGAWYVIIQISMAIT